MIEKEQTNNQTNIANTIAVMSGKGGVGKSSVTSLLAVTLMEAGYKVGIMDADITGPSIPKVFGINKKRVTGTEEGTFPIETSKGIKVMSVNILVEDETTPIVWRGPAISNSVKQFYTEVTWGDLDYLLIDLPPGTGDVPLTIMQSFDIDGVIIVSTPQDLVGMIVKKSIKMANMMKIPVLGLIENMSYYKCSACNKTINIFGNRKVSKLADEMGLEILAQIPIDPDLSKLCDEGKIELYGKINFTFKEYFSNIILDKLGGVAK